MVQNPLFLAFCSTLPSARHFQNLPKTFRVFCALNTWTANERLPNAGAERSPSSKLLGRALDPHGEASLGIVEFSMPCWPDPLGKAYHQPIHAGAERTPSWKLWGWLGLVFLRGAHEEARGHRIAFFSTLPS